MLKKILAAFPKGLAWAMAISVVAFFFGYYNVASDWLGFWALVVLAMASIGLLPLFRTCPKKRALINYEMCVLAVWGGHLHGTYALGGGNDIQWFCIGFFWPWLFFAVIGGIGVLSISHDVDVPNRRTTRVALITLVAAAALVTCGFVQLRLCGEQPITSFRAIRFFLRGMAFSPDGKTLATIGALSKCVRLWDAATGRAIGKCDKEMSDDGLEAPAVQCFGNPPMVAVSSYLSDFPNSNDKVVVQSWNLATQKLEHRLIWNDSIETRSSAFSRDGRWFVYSDGSLRAFDLSSGRIVVDLKRQKDEGVRCVIVSPMRDRLACATYAKEVEIWNVSEAKLEQRIHAAAEVFSLDFSPDGRFLAYGTKNGMVEEIEIGQEKAVAKMLCFNAETIFAVAFSPDGTMLACAGGENVSAKVIDVRRWKVVRELRTWGAWRSECLAFSRDGRRLATGDANGIVGIWDTTKWLDGR